MRRISYIALPPFHVVPTGAIDGGVSFSCPSCIDQIPPVIELDWMPAGISRGASPTFAKPKSRDGGCSSFGYMKPTIYPTLMSGRIQSQIPWP